MASAGGIHKLQILFGLVERIDTMHYERFSSQKTAKLGFVSHALPYLFINTRTV